MYSYIFVATQQFQESFSNFSELCPEVCVRFLSRKPGWKESNFQILQAMYQIIESLAQQASDFNYSVASLVIGPLAEKLGDMKLKKAAGSCLSSVAEATSLQTVLSLVCPTLSQLKNPKAITDGLLWVESTLQEFGASGLNVVFLVEFLKKQLGHSQQSVRTAAITILGTFYSLSKQDIRMHLQELNPQQLQLLDAEFAKQSQNTTAELPMKRKQKQVCTPEVVENTLSNRQDVSQSINEELLDVSNSYFNK